MKVRELVPVVLAAAGAGILIVYTVDQITELTIRNRRTYT